ncbi:MAG TPA: hypothetical protein VK856_13410 [Anaerolineaceae bacterium]|nr:hypothetical protein [Anaerolineaceae bacterium]
MAEKKEKSLLNKAIDALTNRDEKEAAADAEAKKLQSQKVMAEAKVAQAARVKAEAAAKAKADDAAKAKAAEEQKKAQERLAKVQEEQKARVAARKEEIEQKKEEAAKAAIVKHVWTNEDTYASLAFEHYGSIKEPYWRLIYNHNKEIIGDHPNHIKTGTEIEIPPLPEELKKK